MAFESDLRTGEVHPDAVIRPFRVGYVLTFDPAGSMSLWEKLQDRIAIWAEHGVQVHVAVCVRPGSPLLAPALPVPFPVSPLIARRSFLATAQLWRWARAAAPDVIYARYALPWPALRSLAKVAPLVLEHHADETMERRWRPIGVKVVSRAFAGYVLRRASGFVYIDPALVDSTHLSKFGVPSKVITNGVRLDESVPFGSEREREPGPPRLVMSVGALARWHGLDRFVQLATFLPEFEFHVLGSDPVGYSPANVRYHGRLGSAEHDRILRRMDVGVGSLGLERIDCEYASPLKVRGYVRAGLPVVLGHTDPDLSAPDESVLSLGYPVSITPEVADQVREFVVGHLGITCGRSVADRVDAHIKELARLEFLQTFVSAHQG